MRPTATGDAIVRRFAEEMGVLCAPRDLQK
jgi:hypothetical protein